MRSLASRYPNYLWERNVGYSTLAHLQGLAAHGVTPHHRRSFIPVRQLSFDLAGDESQVIDIPTLTAMLDAGLPSNGESFVVGDQA